MSKKPIHVHESHVLYIASDFTKEEIARHNPLAVAVLDQELRICKYCGRQENILEYPCGKLPPEAYLNQPLKED